MSGILPICTQSRENAIESVWLQPVAQRALPFLHIDSSRIYHCSSCRTPTMTVESSSLSSKYVSCLHRRSCLVYAHQEERALVTCSLVPRPHPVFQCCTLKSVFHRATLKKNGLQRSKLYLNSRRFILHGLCMGRFYVSVIRKVGLLAKTGPCRL